ncbi:MAG: YbaB/EbfC family nucleoid-associated protein [Gammaproteobacteria bacterium]|nr:MAG: YbaB/EbfC family nucleoid-associated protein [Gammaproteobacteria bacterium]
MFEGGLEGLMKKAQEIQSGMVKAQEDLVKIEETGESGGGMVKVTLNGKYEARKVEIDDSLIGDDKDMLEDLVASAITAATHKIEKATKEKMSAFTGGIDLPPGFKMPFGG